MKRKYCLLICLILMASFFCAACSSKDKSNEPISSLVGNPAANAGNVFRFASESPHGIFNGVLYTAIYDKAINNLVFDTLVKYDKVTLDFLPRLAEKWELNEENKTLTFWIRKGVKIHNGYGELAAEDIAFTFKMIMEPKYEGPYYSLIKNITGSQEYKEGASDKITGIILYGKKPEKSLPVTYDNSENNPYKITFTLDQVTMSIMHSAANIIFILPRAYYDKENYEDFKALNLAPVGTGPMVYVRYVIDQFVELEAFTDYWDGRPKVDKLIYKCVTDDARIAELQSGGIDACEIRATDEDFGQVEPLKFVHIDKAQGDRYAFMGFAFGHKLFQNINVRKALTYGFNRAAFVKSYTGGRSGLTVAPVIKTSWAYPKEGLIQYKYNPQKAGELLDKAGWKLENDGFRYKDGKKLSITYTGVANNKYDSMKTAVMIEDYKKIGVELKPKFYEWASYLHNLKTNSDIHMFGMAQSMTPDPYSHMFITGNAENYGHYSNPRVDELMESGKTTLERKEATRIYHEVFKIINNDLPYIFLNDYQICYGINNRIKNITIAPFINWTYDFHKVEIIQ